MKNLIVFFIVLCALSSVSAQKVGEKVYKEVSLGGKETAKWFELYDLSEYDNNGNLVYCERGSSKVWREYDNMGNETLFKNNKGEVVRDYYQYDRKGNMIYRQHDDPDGKEDASWSVWYEYDNKGREISSKTQYPSGKISEWKYDYDNHGTKHSKGDGFESWEEYDSHGNLFHYRGSYGGSYNEWWKTFKYNAQGILIYFKDDNYEQWYDEHGNEVHTKYSSGLESWTEYKYDDSGHIIHAKYSNGSESEYEYDDNGHILYSYYKTVGFEMWTYHEYTFHQNGKVKTDKTYEAKQWK